MSARSDCVYLQPLKLGAGRDSWLIINILTTSTAGESNGGAGRGGGKEGGFARWRRSRLGGIRSILSEYDGSTLHTGVVRGASGTAAERKGENGERLVNREGGGGLRGRTGEVGAGGSRWIRRPGLFGREFRPEYRKTPPS